MSLLKSVRGLFRQATISNDRFRELRGELDQLTRSEDMAVRFAGTPLGVPYEKLLGEILTLRERRVEVMHEMGWHKEADSQAADNEMRRAWDTPDGPLAI